MHRGHYDILYKLEDIAAEEATAPAGAAHDVMVHLSTQAEPLPAAKHSFEINDYEIPGMSMYPGPSTGSWSSMGQFDYGQGVPPSVMGSGPSHGHIVSLPSLPSETATSYQSLPSTALPPTTLATALPPTSVEQDYFVDQSSPITPVLGHVQIYPSAENRKSPFRHSRWEYQAQPMSSPVQTPIFKK